MKEQLLQISVPVIGRMMHSPGGDTQFQRYGKDDSECNYSISRVELNKFLIDQASKDGAVFHFDHNLSETSDFGGSNPTGCVLNFAKDGKRFRVKVGCPVIACDGGGSRVRYALRRAGLTEFTEDVLSRGYKEVLFPKPEGDSH